MPSKQNIQGVDFKKSYYSTILGLMAIYITCTVFDARVFYKMFRF